MLATIVSFDPHHSTYPSDFPKSINLREIDPISQQSYAEGFKAAQAAFVPYYDLVVVKSADSFYHVYDATFFSKYADDNRHDLRDPISRQKINDIQHVFMRCFKIDKNALCRPVDLEKNKNNLRLLSFKTDDLDIHIHNMLQDSLNYNIHETGTKESQDQARRTQKILAKLISQGKLFSFLTEGQKNREAIPWLWCSAKTFSLSASLALATECKSNRMLRSHYKKGLEEIIKNANVVGFDSLSRQDRIALHTASLNIKKMQPRPQ
jgi:hypothetical protein